MSRMLVLVRTSPDQVSKDVITGHMTETSESDFAGALEILYVLVGKSKDNRRVILTQLNYHYELDNYENGYGSWKPKRNP